MNTLKDNEVVKPGNARPLKLSCFSFLENGQIPPRYTCDGININPALYIDEIPKGTKSLAVLVEDPDVPHDTFCHWVAWNIPVTNLIKEKENRGSFGINDFGNHCYNGPHPFSTTHRYFFKVYALKTMLNLPANSTKNELKKAIKNQVLASGVITGKYKKQQLVVKNVLPAKTKQNFSEELMMLLAEKGNTCVTITFPLHHLPAEQKTDKLHLMKLVREACDMVSAHYPSEAPQVIENLKKLQDEISFNTSDEGVGIYTSSDMSFYSTFSFPVAEKIVTDKSFHLKEMFTKEQYAVPYNVLYIDEKEVRVYAGKFNQLHEVKTGGFPLFYDNTYTCPLPGETNPAVESLFVNRFERKSYEWQQFSHRNFMEEAEDLSHAFLQNADMLVVCGVRRYVTEFINHTTHANKIVSVMNGYYSRFTETDLATMIWPSIKAHIDEKIIDELNELKEKNGEGLTEQGIVSVWEGVAAGRGETLLVEKSLSMKGFLDHADSWHLYLHPPRHSHIELQDAVNELITAMLNNDGRIVIVEDGTLNAYQQIALTTKF
jgi:Raf kinase inhibitor-like YbhB/YbcL family protein